MSRTSPGTFAEKVENALRRKSCDGALGSAPYCDPPGTEGSSMKVSRKWSNPSGAAPRLNMFDIGWTWLNMEHCRSLVTRSSPSRPAMPSTTNRSSTSGCVGCGAKRAPEFGS